PLPAGQEPAHPGRAGPLEDPQAGVERRGPGAAVEGDGPEPLVVTVAAAGAQFGVGPEPPLGPPRLGPHEMVVGLVEVAGAGAAAEHFADPGRARPGQPGDEDPGPAHAGRLEASMTFSSRTSVKFWWPAGPGGAFVPSSQTQLPAGDAEPRSA